MLGQIVEWLYHDLCGIRPVDGFKTFAIHPAPVAGLSWAKASYVSEYGLIESRWSRESGKMVYEVTVPPNSSAVLELPGLAVQTVGSGRNRFVSP
jgi:alpha-L-rhamnosidase